MWMVMDSSAAMKTVRGIDNLSPNQDPSTTIHFSKAEKKPVAHLRSYLRVQKVNCWHRFWSSSQVSVPRLASEIKQFM